MKLRTRVAVSAAVVTAMAAGSLIPGTTVQAVEGDQFEAQATAAGLVINLFGQPISIAETSATVNSEGVAEASGQGAFIVSSGFGESSARVDAVGQTDGGIDPICSPLVLPEVVPLLGLSAACSSSEASSTESGLSARASGQAIEISLSGEPILGELPIADLTGQVVGTLLGGLAPLFGSFPVPTEVVVDQLTETIRQTLTGEGISILKIVGGGSSSSASSDASSVTATAESTGLTITVLDRSLLGLEPVLTIEVGSADSTVTRDRATGEVTTAENGAAVRITVAADIALLLNLPERSFNLLDGGRIDLPLPNPLASSIVLAEGTVTDTEDGTEVSASAVDINLLSGLNGGVRLGLSSGSVALAGQVAPTEPPTTEPAPPATDPAPTTAPAPAGPTPTRTTLPRTGVEERNLQLAALLLVITAAGVLTLVRASARRTSRG